MEIMLWLLQPEVWMTIGSLVGFVGAVGNTYMRTKSWEKAVEIAKKESYKLMMSTLQNSKKRDIVIDAVWNLLPKKYKFFIKPSMLKDIVEIGYRKNKE